MNRLKLYLKKIIKCHVSKNKMHKLSKNKLHNVAVAHFSFSSINIYFFRNWAFFTHINYKLYAEHIHKDVHFLARFFKNHRFFSSTLQNFTLSIMKRFYNKIFRGFSNVNFLWKNNNNNKALNLISYLKSDYLKKIAS